MLAGSWRFCTYGLQYSEKVVCWLGAGGSVLMGFSTVRRLCVGWELEVLYLWASVQ